MPKLTEKVVTKIKPKASTKEAVSEKQKGEREALIESLRPSIVNQIIQISETEEKAGSLKLQLVSNLKKLVTDKSLSEDDVKLLLRLSYAKRGEYDPKKGKYIEYPAIELKGKQSLVLHGTHANQVSTLARLVFPKKNSKRFFADLDATLEGKKKISFQEFVKAARDEAGAPPKEGPGKGSGRTTAARNAQARKEAKPYDTLEQYELELAGLLQKCEKSEFNDEEVQDRSISAITKWLERKED